MADVPCAHCDTLITDHSCAVVREGKTYCCNNCAKAAARAAAPSDRPKGP
jgi:hypothetical protein